MKRFLPVAILFFMLCTEWVHAQVVLNEVLGSTTSTDSEFIELFNAGGTAVDISGWMIKVYESDSGSQFGTEDTNIEIPANVILPAGSFYLIGNARFESQYQIIPDQSIPDNSIENSSYTIILKDENDIRENSVFVTDGGAGDQANDAGTVITPDLSVGPDGTFLPAGFSRDTDGANTAQILDFSPDPSLASTPKYSNSKRNTDIVTVSTQTDLAEPATNGEFLLSLVDKNAPSGGVLVNYTLSGSATLGTDYLDPNGGSVLIPSGSKAATINLTIQDDNLDDPDETVIVTITSVASGFTIGNEQEGMIILDDDNVSTTLISAIQGSGSSSPLINTTVTVEAIVIGDFQGGSSVGINGFFIQEEDADADGDATTSEGIFVFDRDLNPAVVVNEQDKVLITATVNEFSGNTELNPTSITVISSGNPLPSKTSIDLPLSSPDDYEQYEGMLVTFVDELFITEFFNLDRFGEIRLAEGGRFENFTECNEPNTTNFNNYLTNLDNRSIILDDGRTGEDLFPIRLPDGSDLAPNNTIRGNDKVTDLCGALDFRFGSYRIQPTTNATLTANNPRPSAAPNVGGNIKIASINVLNYFNGDGLGGGFPAPRGATTFSDFERQSLKISKAVCKLDADIIGIQEIENDGFGANGALQTLVDDIAAECGLVYDFVDPGTPQIGTDEIAVGLIYKTTTVSEAGTAAILDTPASLFVGSGTNRAVLAQTFEVTDNTNPDFGEKITLAVNHFKSKGSSCGAGDDATDGSGNCNETRRLAAEALANWLATDPTNSQVVDQMILGDLNAYRNEDPIQLLDDKGFINTITTFTDASDFPCGGDYSFVFDGQWGSLDYALANLNLLPDVTGAASWHVNADESDALDYTTTDNDPSLFAADEFRFSDHDPVVVGLDLNTQQASGICQLTDAINETPIADDTYQAATISSKGTVQMGSNVTFQAEELIVLRAGFSAKSNFTARIAPCTPSAEEEAVVENRTVVTEMITTSDLAIYPNPIGAFGQLNLTLPYDSAVRIELIDISGKLVKTLLNQKVNQGKHQFELDFSNLKASGYYLIKMITEQEITTIKVVK